MTAECQYFTARALREAVRAIDAPPGALRRVHEEMSRAYSRRVIAALAQRDRQAGVLPLRRRAT